MAERFTVVDQENIKYTGFFDINELTRMIDLYFRTKAYDKRVIRDEEHVYKDHKFIHIWWEPYKKITDYIKFEVRIWVNIANVTQVTKEIDGVKTKLNKGEFDVRLDGFLITDYENRWEQKPLYFFFRTIFDKFIYKMQMAKYEALIKEHVMELKAEIASFLNLYRFY